MTTNSDFDRHASAWLADGPTELADRVLDAALREVHLTPQRRRWSAPWRATLMSLRLGAAALIVLVAVVGILAFTMRGNGVGPPAGPSPSPTTQPTSIAVATPTPNPNIDTSTWTTYVSTRYGFSIGHPADWVVLPANHDWAFPADATQFPPSAGETFHTGDVAVSAYSLAVTPGTSVATWLQAYCPVAESDSPCTALQSRTVAVSMDGHAGSLVQFNGDTQAYILVGSRLYIVGCWRAESDATVAQYGGASRLLEAYLSTIHLLPGGPATPAPTTRPS
jgi:hypothetical protein